MKKQVIFITGTSSGLGSALGSLCAEKEHIVYGCSRNPSKENSLFQNLQADVMHKESIKNAVETILAREGKLDVVIHNAGLGIIGPTEYLDGEDIQKVWQTNVHGLINVVQTVLPSMRRNNSGKIIFISSIASEIALPFRGIYCASKAAGDRIIQSLRMELSGTRISCCSVQAGDIQTEINAHRLKVKQLDDSFYADIVHRTNLHVDEQVNKGMSAGAVAAEIYRLIDKPTMLPITYQVGKPIQKISLLLKRLLPEVLFEKIIAAYSG
jgi:NADP-dependent 3-hydroxy acid dehydrogenase YdfG